MDAVHIVGAGGIGCAVGYALRAAGVPVTFIESNRLKVESGRREGVRVDDRPALPAGFVLFEDWTPDPNALVLLCTKCYDNAKVLAKLPTGATFVPIQNGFDPMLVARGHATEGIASFVSECATDRPHTRITRPGDLHIGAASGGRREETGDRSQEAGKTDSPASLSPVPCLLSPGERSPLAKSKLFRVVEVADIAPIKHTKLMYNAAISPLAAAAGIDNGQLLSVPAARKLFFALLQENHSILRDAGVELGKVGPFHPRTVAWILRRRWLAGLMAKFFEPSLRGTYCSMAGEIQKGRTELDNYNGHLLRLAEATGTPCPLNRAVYELVTKMTAERAAPRRGILEELAEPSRPPRAA